MSGLPVVIVRPHKSFLEMLIFGILNALLGGLLVWLLLDLALRVEDIGYLRSVAVFMLARALFGDSSYIHWTKPGLAPRKKAS